MGLLSRFRHASSSTPTPSDAGAAPASASATTSHPAPTPRPTTPTPLAELSPPPPSFAKQRPNLPPPSSSNSSIASRISRKPWKRAQSHTHVLDELGKVKEKQKEKGKGKERAKADDGTIGVPYEDTSSPLPTPNGLLAIGTSRSAPNTPQGRRRSTFLTNSVNVAQPSSPLVASTSMGSMLVVSTDHDDRHETLNQDDMGTRRVEDDEDRKALRQARVLSGQFKQEGGILGRLNFEFADGLGTSPPDKWLKRASDSHDPVSLHSPPQTQRKLAKSRTSKTPSPKKQDLPLADVSPHDTERLADGMADTSLEQPQAVADEDGQFDGPTPTKSDNRAVFDQRPVPEEEKMELLESAEKKTKFWKRPRRHSRSVSVSEPVEMDRSGSPTPRKPSGPSNLAPDLTAVRTSSELQQPRPQQLRRPSSSLFHNPFTRSVSRTSLALDLDKSAVDDGSFQLRGFRHVSGMMEVEGPGELENYLSHFRKDPTATVNTNQRPAAPNSSDQVVSPTLGSTAALGLGEPTSPPSSFTPGPRPRQASKPLSRPPSIANSLASATGDEFIIPSARVSVAAFRKGIRRPSEGLTTMSDIGHGHSQGSSLGVTNGLPSALHDGDDGDDDDLPLGILNKRKELGREKSSQSLSSIRNMEDKVINRQPLVPPHERKSSPSSAASSRDRSFSPSPIPSPGATPYPATSASFTVADSASISREASPALSVGGGEGISRKPSPNPALSFTVQRQKHKRNGGGSGGFVVKSTRLSRDDLLPKTAAAVSRHASTENPDQDALRPPMFATPPASAPSTPYPPLKQKGDEGRIPLASSPDELSPVDGYFSSIAPYIATFQTQGNDLAHQQQAANSGNVDYNSSRHSPGPARAPGPPVEPISIPQPGDKTPASLHLPLPPDQMPDTPPKEPQPLPIGDNGETPLSPGARKRMSLLEEPMRIISGLWNSPSTATGDGFDPALVLNSMTAYGGDEEVGSRSPDHPDKPLEHQSSHTTLFDLGKSTPAEDSDNRTNAGERVRSPLSERLAGVTYTALGDRATKLSLPQLKTAQAQETNDGYATERYRSPTSDSALSPSYPIAAALATATVPPPATSTSTSPARTTFASSFARAKPRRSKVQESSSEESERETTSEGVSQGKMGMTPLTARRASNSTTQTSPRRRHPSGPRKPSITARNRMSSMTRTITPTSPRRPVSNFTVQPTKASRPDRPDSGSEDEDEQPLGVLRNKASRSTLSVDRQGKSPSPSTLSVPQQRPMPHAESRSGQSMASVPSRSPPERRKTLIELGPVHQPLRDRSTEFEPSAQRQESSHTTRPRSRSRASNSSAAALPNVTMNGNPPPPSTHTRSPARTLIQLPPDEVAPFANVGRKTASPDSSRSATTGGSGAYQPMTPKEGSEVTKAGPRRRDPSAPGRKTLYEEPTGKINALQVEDRPRAYSSHGQHQPPQHAGQWQPNVAMQDSMGTQSMQGMHPDAMREMMKQQWQMQFMAAAYRASEEEWERQSSVSAQTNHTVPASFGQYPPPMPNGMPPMGWNMPPHMSMGMGIGSGVGMQYPSPNMPFGYPSDQGQGYGFGVGMYPPYGYAMPPFSPTSTVAGFSGGGGGGGGGGMYSYGGGARSVFGGEFGPPAIPPSQRYTSALDVPNHNHNHNRNHSSSQAGLSSSQSAVGGSGPGPGLRPARGRRGSGARSVYAVSVSGAGPVQSQVPGIGSGSSPPSSWSRRNGSGSGDWSELAQSAGGLQGKPRPQTSYAN
ncbi:hypothetical protein IAU59_007128 [Kwoniella sp. CBS 9459]